MDRLRLPTSLTTGLAHRLPSLRPHTHRPQLRGLRPCPSVFFNFLGEKPPAFGLRASLAGWTPSGRRVKARAATAQRLGLDAPGTTPACASGGSRRATPARLPPEPHGGECGESRGAAPRWARPQAAQLGGFDAPPRWGGTLCGRGSRAEGVGEPRRGAPLPARNSMLGE